MNCSIENKPKRVHKRLPKIPKPKQTSFPKALSTTLVSRTMRGKPNLPTSVRSRPKHLSLSQRRVWNLILTTSPLIRTFLNKWRKKLEKRAIDLTTWARRNGQNCGLTHLSRECPHLTSPAVFLTRRASNRSNRKPIHWNPPHASCRHC